MRFSWPPNRDQDSAARFADARYIETMPPPRSPSFDPEASSFERGLWVLVKDRRSVHAVERAHPEGREFRILHAGSMLWAQVVRPGDTPSFEAVVAEQRSMLIGRGWSDSE